MNEFETAAIRRDLRRRSLFAGFCIVGIVAMQMAASMLLGGPLQRAKETAGASVDMLLAYYGLYIGYYCLTLMALPAILALIFRRPVLAPRQDRKPVGASRGILLILFGLALCVLANYAVTYWLRFASAFGIEPGGTVVDGNGGLAYLLLDLLTFALVPALVEETVFRGWILGSLRPYGERRALLLSALIFGLMHMNLTQAPFAFLLGLVFGYIFLRTGRLWPGMVIHFLNNALSVALEHARITLGLSENDAALLSMAAFTLLALAGTLAAILLRDHPDCRELVKPRPDRYSPLPASARSRMMWFDPAVIVGVGLMTLLTVTQEILV